MHVNLQSKSLSSTIRVIAIELQKATHKICHTLNISSFSLIYSKSGYCYNSRLGFSDKLHFQ